MNGTKLLDGKIEKLKQNGWVNDPWHEFKQKMKTRNLLAAITKVDTKIISTYIPLYQPQLKRYKAFFIAKEMSKGSPLYVHGGLSYALMDTVGASFCALVSKCAPLTKEVKLIYKKPIEINKPYEINAKILDSESSNGNIRKINLEITIYDQNQSICVTAQSLFYIGKMKLPIPHLSKL